MSRYIDAEKYENAIAHIIAAKEAAISKQIEANTIILNKSFAYSHGLLCGDIQYPPFIAGLKVVYTSEKLPLDANFIVYQNPRNPQYAEVQHGEWKYTNLDNFRKYKVECPFCGAAYTDNYDGYISAKDFNFCPNCGARMDGDEN